MHSALCFAADIGNADIIEALMKMNDLDVNAKAGSFQNTALHLAVFKNHIGCVRVMVKHKAKHNLDTTIVNKEGLTAEEMAKKRGFKGCLKLLNPDYDANSVNDDDILGISAGLNAVGAGIMGVGAAMAGFLTLETVN